MVNFTPIMIYDSELKILPVKMGQLICTKDTHSIYIDVSNSERKSLNQISVITEAEKIDMAAPVSGFYYIIDENSLYFFNSDWLLINDNTPTIDNDGILQF